MKIDTLSTILQKSKNPKNLTKYSNLGQVDFGKPFLPEDRTQLYFTDIYFKLTDPQRLRYNQLFGGRINEYIMVLESDIVDFFLRPLLNNRKIKANKELAECLNLMIEEELRHYQMFRNLNLKSLPEIYKGKADRQFTRMPISVRPCLKFLKFSASLLPFPIWYVMAMEEEAIDLAKEMKRASQTETLGELDPVFTSVHHEHMKDEARHIAIDKYMAEECLVQASVPIRKLGAYLFKMTMRALTSVGPNGPGARVINHLLEEHPELESKRSELFNALVSLNNNKAYQTSLFNRKGAPLSFHLFDQIPEFKDLNNVMVGYDRK